MPLLGSDHSWGKPLLLIGGGIFALGLVVLILERLGLSLGKLPGDIRLEGKRGTFYFPLTTCLALSAVGTLLLHLMSKR